MKDTSHYENSGGASCHIADTKHAFDSYCAMVRKATVLHPTPASTHCALCSAEAHLDADLQMNLHALD